MQSLLLFVSAFVIAFALVPFCRWLGLKIGAIDEPRPTKIHTQPIPRIGGVAIYLATTATILMAPLWGADYALTERLILAFFLGGTLMCLSGLLDDLVELSPLPITLSQIGSAVVVLGLGLHFSLTQITYLDYAFTLLWFVGLLNVVNFMDGLDGLAGGLTVIAGVSLLAAALYLDASTVTMVAAALIGASLAFLHYNRRPASIFMGNSGSQYLAFVTGLIAVALTREVQRPISGLGPLLIMAVPIGDAAFTLLRRWLGGVRGRSLFSQHLHHFYNYLAFTRKGYKQVMGLLFLSGVLFGLSGTLLLAAPSTYSVAFAIALVILACVGVLRTGFLKSSV